MFGKCSDPVDTFDWLIEQDNKLIKKYGDIANSIYFLMTCDKSKHDMGYINNSEKLNRLLKKLKKDNIFLGLHVSYEAGKNPELILNEARRYAEIVGEKPLLSRNHYLACREPEDFYKLIVSGITDDYSGCYADRAGFRYGTCKPFKWIDPVEMKITTLTLHPLMATEGKLCSPEYMGMSYEEAKGYLLNQFNKIKKYNGELIILFHNSSVVVNNEFKLRELYEDVINSLV